MSQTGDLNGNSTMNPSSPSSVKTSSSGQQRSRTSYTPRPKAKVSPPQKRVTSSSKKGKKASTTNDRRSSEARTEGRGSFSPIQAADLEASGTVEGSGAAGTVESNGTILGPQSGDFSVSSLGDGSSQLSALSKDVNTAHHADHECDLDEICRKRGLKRLLSVIHDNDDAETESERVPQKMLHREAMLKMLEQYRKTAATIERLQRHFNIVKEKLYRARCLGMDQGIEAVHKGESPFLEQHMLKINNVCQEELLKAKQLEEARIRSINLQYETSIKCVWDSVETELQRRQNIRKVELVEKMIKTESDFMHNQLRHTCNRWKENARNGRFSKEVISGVVVDTGTEASIDEAAADLWKMMKVSIRHKYWRKYLSPEAVLRTATQEHLSRQRLIQKLMMETDDLAGNGIECQETTQNAKYAQMHSGRRGKKRHKVSVVLDVETLERDLQTPINMVVEEFQDQELDLELDPLHEGSDLPGVQISIPDSEMEYERNITSGEFFRVI